MWHPGFARDDAAPSTGGLCVIVFRTRCHAGVNAGFHRGLPPPLPSEVDASPKDALQRVPYRALLIDDDLGTRETFTRAFEAAGLLLVAVARGTKATEIACSEPWDLLIVDVGLPGMDDLAAAWALEPWILVSGLLSASLVVAAMRQGAIEVLEKPIDVDSITRTALRHLRGFGPTSGDARTAWPLRERRAQPRPASAADRWALYVLKACGSVHDPKTLQEWSRCAGVSYTTLCESCRILGVQPRPARDFARTLRALLRGAVRHCAPEVLLDVSDRRTLRLLTRRAGPVFVAAEPRSVLQFIHTQGFVEPQNPGVRALIYRLTSSDDASPHDDGLSSHDKAFQ